MVHVIRDPGFITIVIDKRDDVVESILSAVRCALRDDIFFTPAMLAA